jgi:3-methyladenine DNA glycosylase AlkD
MRKAELRHLATACRDAVATGEIEEALSQLRPLISARTPFSQLDMTGEIFATAAAANPAGFNSLLDSLAATNAIGAWPLIGSALAAAYTPGDLPRAFAAARRYILQADVWHAADAIAERVLGEGLRADFDTAISLLEPWREEHSPWLRRAVGVAAHRYAKRERDHPARARRLLELLAPMFDERETAAIKGVGWGLKTIGKFHPDLLQPWLDTQMATGHPRKLMIRKATTYLPQKVKDRFLS